MDAKVVWIVEAALVPCVERTVEPNFSGDRGNLDGKISDERFAKMTATYEQEQKDLSARIIVLRDAIAKAKTQRLNIGSFLAQVKKYTEVKEPGAEIIRALVERIDMFKPEKVPGTRAKKQAILIHWNFIGAVELPKEQEKSA